MKKLLSIHSAIALCFIISSCASMPSQEAESLHIGEDVPVFPVNSENNTKIWEDNWLNSDDMHLDGGSYWWHNFVYNRDNILWLPIPTSMPTRHDAIKGYQYFIGVSLDANSANRLPFKLVDAGKIFSARWDGSSIPNHYSASHSFTVDSDGSIIIRDCPYEHPIICDLLSELKVEKLDTLSESFYDKYTDRDVAATNNDVGSISVVTERSYFYYSDKNMVDRQDIRGEEFIAKMNESSKDYLRLENLQNANVSEDLEKRRTYNQRVANDAQIAREKQAAKEAEIIRVKNERTRLSEQRQAEALKRQQAEVARQAYLATPEGKAEIAAENERRQVILEKRRRVRQAEGWPSNAIGKIDNDTWICRTLKSSMHATAVDRSGSSYMQYKSDCFHPPTTMYLSKIDNLPYGVAKVKVIHSGYYYASPDRIQR